MGQYTVLTDAERLMKTKMDSDIRIGSIATQALRGVPRPVANFGKKSGQTIEIEKYQNLTVDTSPLHEKRSVPIERNTINFVQATVKEYGRGTSWTKRTDNLAEYAVDEVLKDLIMNNMALTMDQIAGAEFLTGDVFYTPTGATAGTFDTDGTVSTAAGANFNSYHFRDIVNNMRSGNVPFFDGSNYLFVGHILTISGLFNDTALDGVVELKKYTQPEMLMKGEMGQYYRTRVVEENNIFDGFTGGQTTYTGDGVFIGADAVVEGLVEPEHTEFESHDFNRFHAIAWLALTTFKRVWDYSGDNGQYRLVYIHSND